MIPFDILIELCNLAYVRDESWQPDLPATSKSLDRIQHALDFRVPNDFVLFSQKCPAYTNWFPSIGEDYNQSHHILRENEMWRSKKWLDDNSIVPKHLIVLHDWADCNFHCWDTSVLSADEYPIVYYCADCHEPRVPELISSSFRSYLEWRSKHHFPVRLPGVVRQSSGSWSEKREKHDLERREKTKLNNRRAEELLAPYKTT